MVTSLYTFAIECRIRRNYTLYFMSKKFGAAQLKFILRHIGRKLYSKRHKARMRFLKLGTLGNQSTQQTIKLFAILQRTQPRRIG